METPGNIKRASKSKLSQEHLWTLPSSGTFRSSSSKFIIDSWTETCSKLSCTIIRFLSFSQNKLAYRRRQLTTDQINFRKWASHRKVSDSIFFFILGLKFQTLQPTVFRENLNLEILFWSFDETLRAVRKIKKKQLRSRSNQGFFIRNARGTFYSNLRETGCISHLYTNA